MQKGIRKVKIVYNECRWLIKLLLVCVFSVNASANSIRLNEISINNNTYLDENGNAGAWVELYNESSVTVNLNTFYLSNSNFDTKRFKLPSLLLGANQYVIVFLDEKNKYSPIIHANFSVSTKGGSLLLSTSSTVIDQILVPVLESTISYGRIQDGDGAWGFSDVTTPNFSNQGKYKSCWMKSPKVNVSSGTYSFPFNLEILHDDPSATIYYTLDGSEPENTDSVYSGPISITHLDLPNSLSLVPTNPSLQYPVAGGYTDVRAHTRGWLPPYQNVANVNVVKAISYKLGCVSSPVAAHSYLLPSSSKLPVVSILIDSLALFDHETGIYHYGDGPIPNYDKEGMEFERSAVVEYFDTSGILVFSEKLGIRIGGNGSRHSAQKNLKLYFRDQYGNDELKKNIFADENLNVFETLLLRSGGHRPDCLPKDEVGTALSFSLEFDKASFVYTRVYINGEYWGIHSLKQHMNEEHIKNKYDLQMDDIVLLYGKNNVDHGVSQDAIDYTELVDFTASQDLNSSVNFDYVKSKIDLQNYKDYMISQIFLGNADWPFSNIKFWRKRTSLKPYQTYGHDGRYRWMMFDLDGTFGGTCSDVFYTFNTLQYATSTEANMEDYTKLFRGLLNAEEFKLDFINRYCDLLNSTFKSTTTIPKFTKIKNQLDPEMLEHISRWRYPSVAETIEAREQEVPSLTKWEYLTTKMEQYLALRPYYCRNHMKAYWSLSDTAKLSIEVNDFAMGEVKVNSIQVNNQLEGVTTSVYPWVGVYFTQIPMTLVAIAKPGYRFVEWTGTGISNDTLQLVLNSDSNFTAKFEVNPDYTPLKPLLINEFMPSNSTVIKDEYNEFDDWLEIYNPNSVDVSLGDYALTDDRQVPTKFKFDKSLLIPANGFALIWCDNQMGQGIYHTNFKLKNSTNEFIGLFHLPSGLYDDSMRYTIVPQNKSYGRNNDGENTWREFTYSSPNRSNNGITSLESEGVITSSFLVYPNPTDARVLSFSIPISGVLLDFTGNEMLNFDLTDTIHLPNVSPGIYFIKSSDGLLRKVVLF